MNIKQMAQNLIAKLRGPSVQSKDTTGQSIHEVKKTMVEDYFIPGHDPRTNSDVYNKTHNDLVNIKDTPCWICGVKKSTIPDIAQNLYGAKDMETHHFHLEWSLADAVDWNVLKAMHPDFPNWDKIDPNNSDTYKYFVDDEYNMYVLCDVHHRGTYRGIHAIEFPVWIAQKYIRKDFKFINLENEKGVPELLDDMS